MTRHLSRSQFLSLALAATTAGLGGCHHAPPPPTPPVAQAPAMTPSNITVVTPLPSVPEEAKPNVEQARAPQPTPTPTPTPAPVKKHRHLRHRTAPPVQTAQITPEPTAPASPSVATTSTAAASTSAAAAEAEPTIGELSTGSTISVHDKNQVLRAIQSEEGRLSKIKEPASVEGKSLEAQVRSFLVKAREAVAENDLDGAQTLNMKARVLIDELQSE